MQNRQEQKRQANEQVYYFVKLMIVSLIGFAAIMYSGKLLIYLILR